MGCCKSRKETPVLKEEDSLKYMSNARIDLHSEFVTNDVNEQFLKDFFSMANKEENIEKLIKLIDNESLISYDENMFKSTTWISQPKTLGDISLLQIMNIVKKRLVNNEMFAMQEEEEINNSKLNINEVETKINGFTALDLQEKENLINYIKTNNFIQKIMDFIESSSDTKKDASIVILCLISTNKMFCTELLMKKDLIIRLIKHVNSFKMKKNVNYKEHIISTLEIFRNIYVKDMRLRRFFIENGGSQLLYEFLSSADPDIVHEILFNIEDLIYKDDEDMVGDFDTVNHIIAYDIVDLLIKLEINRTLFEFYNDCQKNYMKYEKLHEELNRLLTIFSSRMKFLNKQKGTTLTESTNSTEV